MNNKVGLLLVNLGTPDSPEPSSVAKYLKEFLMDPLVIDIPYLFRWVLVNILIIPKRKTASSLLYKKIWTEKGSPLLYYHLKSVEKVKIKLSNEYWVEGAMRYGKPSIESAIKKLAEFNLQSLIVFPLYPQYSLAASLSSEVEVKRCLSKLMPNTEVKFISPFYSNEAYLSAVTEVSRQSMEGFSWDRVLFSFHGLPERQVKKLDSTGVACRCDDTCCLVLNDGNKNCYRAQSYETARLLAKRMNIPSEKYDVAFQSRLGSTPWIRPYSDELYRTYPKQGIKNVLVFCPSFVADCLETLEEVHIRGNEEFRRHGGEEIRLVPSLNDSDLWRDAIIKIATNFN